MRRRTLPITGALLCTLAAAGCKVGPNYRAPAMPAPPAYSDDGHNGNWETAKPADGIDRGDWWSVYNDAQLSDFEARCAKSNQDIEAALHVYEQAHDLVRENRASLYPTVSIVATGGRSTTMPS